jgi:nitroimidazol reductase NimA-like FMN-containing flavoprotein (pyridoxamine 5'-phosphate oxidase superfamily)
MSESRSDDLVASLEPVKPSECWQLLATASVGRVGFIVDGKPEVLPVNFAIDGETILFRTAEGNVLSNASMSVVAFEVDNLNEGDQSGWSVLVQGFARDIGDAVDPTSRRLKQLTLETWPPGARPRWFHITPDKVTGRRLRVFPAEL